MEELSRTLPSDDINVTLNLSSEHFRDTGGQSRLRDILALDSIMQNSSTIASDADAKDVLLHIRSSLDGLAKASNGLDQQDARSVASQALADLLQGVRKSSKQCKKYHQYAIKMLKQPYMHLEGSRYCLSLGSHTHTGPSAQETLKMMTDDYRSQTDTFQLMEEKLLQFAVDLERELVVEKRTSQELRRVLQLEKLEYTRLLEKFEEMKNFYSNELKVEKTSFRDYKDQVHRERERERDEWEKERDRNRSRNAEREREVDRMVSRHQAEMAGLERDVERYKRETLREAGEVDRLNKELDSLHENTSRHREGLEEQIDRTKKEGESQAYILRAAREKTERDLQEKLDAIEMQRRKALEVNMGDKSSFEAQMRLKDQEKIALHSMLQEKEDELKDSRTKLNTLAADNILLREVMTDLRVNNKRLSSELKETLLVGSSRRPKWTS